MNIKLHLIVAVICLAIGALINGWRLNGEIETIRADHATAQAEASEAAREKEQAMQGEIDTLTAKRKKEQKDYETKINRLNADLAAGRVRLTVPVATCGASTGSGIRLGEARAELDGEASQSLVSIASDGDAAIRELNYCIDAYEAVRGD